MAKRELIQGFKYTYGNKLFRTLGLNNFMILPIADKDIKIGCILVDYFGKNNLISEEEVEVNSLLLMNLLTRIKTHLRVLFILMQKISVISKLI